MRNNNVTKLKKRQIFKQDEVIKQAKHSRKTCHHCPEHREMSPNSLEMGITVFLKKEKTQDVGRWQWLDINHLARQWFSQIRSLSHPEGSVQLLFGEKNIKTCCRLSTVFNRFFTTTPLQDGKGSCGRIFGSFFRCLVTSVVSSAFCHSPVCPNCS